MEKECREYAQHVAEEIEAIYNGTTEEENDDGEKMSLYDYAADALDFSAIVSSQKNDSVYPLVCYAGRPDLLRRYGAARGSLCMGRRPGRICA